MTITLTKLASGNFALVGAALPYPDPADYIVMDDYAGDSIGTHTNSTPFWTALSFDQFGDSTLRAYRAGVSNWDAYEYDPFPAPWDATALSYPFWNNLQVIAPGEQFGICNTTINGFAFDIGAVAIGLNFALDGAQHLAEPLNLIDGGTVTVDTDANSVAGNAGFTYMGLNNSVCFYTNLPTMPSVDIAYTYAAFSDDAGNVTYYNAYQAGDDPLFFLLPKWTEDLGGGDYRSIAFDDGGYTPGVPWYQILWTREPYIDGFNGDWTQVIENIEFDDALINYAFSQYEYGTICVGVDRFYVAIPKYDEDFFIDGIVLIEMLFDLSGYNATYILEGFESFGIADPTEYWKLTASYNTETSELLYLSVFQPILYSGTVTPLSPGEPVYVPHYQPIKLPCFVSCIPVIDRR